MKKLLFVALVLLACISPNLSAQGMLNNTESVTRTSPQQTAFFEAAGPGLVVSFNYDTRFTKKQGGLGARIGVGGFALGNDASLLTVPVQINYLAGGRNGHYFEVGGGVTYASGDTPFDQETKVFGTAVFGYRYQPEGSGLNFRGGFSPIFGDTSDGAFFIPYWPHLSLGYTF